MNIWLYYLSTVWVGIICKEFTDKPSSQCTAMGTYGAHCDECEAQSGYFGSGDKTVPGCFYSLVPDLKYTFRLNKPDHENITAINWRYVPNKPNADVEFSLSCADNCTTYVSMKLYYKSYGGVAQLVNMTSMSLHKYKFTFPKEKFNPRQSTFLVQLERLKTPVGFVISFSQQPKLDLLQLFMSTLTALKQLENVHSVKDGESKFTLKKHLKRLKLHLLNLFTLRLNKKQQENIEQLIESINKESKEDIVTATHKLVESIKEDPPKFEDSEMLELDRLIVPKLSTN